MLLASINSQETNTGVMDSLTKLARGIQAAFTEATNSTVNSVNQLTQQAVSGITDTAQDSLTVTLTKADNVIVYMTDSLQKAISSLLYDWFKEHPLIFWLVTHPLVTLSITFISLFLLWRLLNAIGSLVDRLWLWILRSPWLVGKSLFRLGKKQVTGTADSVKELTETEKLTYILTKLEAIEQQQQQIMQELVTLKQTKEHINKEKIYQLPREELKQLI
jgi:hypothetical protein